MRAEYKPTADQRALVDSAAAKDGVNIMKGYMESGEFSRGRESIRAEGSIVMIGNFDVDVQHQLHVGHLLGPLPPEMRNDTAFMDRIHCYLPGWDIPKVSKELFTDRFGLVTDVLAECFSRLRAQSRVNILPRRVHFGGALSGRDQNAVNKVISGLLKLIYPDPAAVVHRVAIVLPNGAEMAAAFISIASGATSLWHGGNHDSLAIREMHSKSDLYNAEWLHDLSETDANLGDAFRKDVGEVLADINADHGDLTRFSAQYGRAP
jgi:Putative ATP-dependent Lon protease